MFGTSKEKINEFIESLKRPKDKKAKSECQCKDGGFDFTVEISIEKFLGVEVSQADYMIMLSQPYLIERIIYTVGFQDKNHAASLHHQQKSCIRMKMNRITK